MRPLGSLLEPYIQHHIARHALGSSGPRMLDTVVTALQEQHPAPMARPQEWIFNRGKEFLWER